MKATWFIFHGVIDYLTSSGEVQQQLDELPLIIFFYFFLEKADNLPITASSVSPML